MNILLVHSSDELYGSDRSLVALTARLTERGNRCLVALPGRVDGPLTRLLRSSGAQVLHTDVLKLQNSKKSIFQRWRKKLRAVVRDLDHGVHAFGAIDVVHSNTSAVLAGAAWARRHNIPHVWTVREILSDRPLVARAVARMLFHGANAVTYNSQATRDFWEAVGPDGLRDKGFTILNRVDARADALPAIPDDTTTVRLALIGRINGWKGHEELVAAIEQLPATVAASLHVSFVGGSPPGRPDLEENLRRRISASPRCSAFSIHDFVSDIYTVLSATDVVVTPSTRPEPFGRVPVEAAIAGVPTIATNHGGFRETIVHGVTGILVEPGQLRPLSEAIELLVTNGELRRRMGRAARAHAIRSQSTDAMATEYLTSYSTAVSAHKLRKG
ncbi:glycosyltransferase family 4 protein [Demequina maris]|uniref:glycosyltransferase family 4 protein n=1 Tax=Demequina maris TaxID=1638982 RepID=UPI0009E2671B|nr:glycosyltransferase family 4 protein [Demequina maris]